MIQYYHPNPHVTGSACSFWYSDRDDAVFATLIKQAGWDAQNKNGTFKASLEDPEKKINIKLNFTEVAAILDCVERNRPFTTFHDSDEKPKQIGFVPWMTQGDNPVQKGYSFSVTVKDKQNASFKNSFYIGFSFAEGREIREFLIHTMHEHFRRMRKKVTAPASATPAPAQEPEPAPTNNSGAQTVKDPLTDF